MSQHDPARARGRASGRPGPGIGLAVGLAVAAMVSVQTGVWLAVPVIHDYGALSTSGLRLCWAALALLLFVRPPLHRYGAAQWRAALVLGTAMAVMSLAFFLAIERLPQHLTVALEFCGPLAVAALGARGWRALAWAPRAAIASRSRSAGAVPAIVAEALMGFGVASRGAGGTGSTPLRRSCSAMRCAAVGGVPPVARSITTSRPPRSTTEYRPGGVRSSNAELILQCQHRERGFRRLAALILARLVGARKRLFFVLHGQNAVTDSKAVERECHDPARAFIRHHFEMIGFAADDDAKRDIAVITAALIGKRDRRRNFERAGDGHDLVAMSFGFERAAHAIDQHVVEMGIETRFDDQDMGHHSPPGIARSPTTDRP